MNNLLANEEFQVNFWVEFRRDPLLETYEWWLEYVLLPLRMKVTYNMFNFVSKWMRYSGRRPNSIAKLDQKKYKLFSRTLDMLWKIAEFKFEKNENYSIRTVMTVLSEPSHLLPPTAINSASLEHFQHWQKVQRQIWVIPQIEILAIFHSLLQIFHL